MRMVDDILWSFTNCFVVMHLYDILIFNKTKEENLQYI